MIRPSSLQIAELCGLSHRLAEQYPESSEYADAGKVAHEQAAAGLTGKTTPIDPAVRTAVEAILEEFDILGVEVPLTLIDPETDEIVCSGTADVVARSKSDGILTVIDHKTGRPERVTPAADNLQLHAYALAAAIQSDETAYTVMIAHIVDGKFWFGRQCSVEGEGMWLYLNRIKRAVATASAEPAEAYRGSHCDGCFQQKHCPSYMLPAHSGPSALEPFTRPDGLTPANALQALRVVEAMDTATSIAKDRLKAFVREFGPIVDNGREWGPTQVSGRRSGPSVKELESRGLQELIRQGEPMERWQWKKSS